MLRRVRLRSLSSAVAIGHCLRAFAYAGFSCVPACILVVAVVLGQFGTIVIPPLLKSILFGLFVFTIGYRSGRILCLAEPPDAFAGRAALVMERVGSSLFSSLLHAASWSRHRRRSRRRQSDADIDDGHRVGRIGAAWPLADELKQQQQIRSRLRVTYILAISWSCSCPFARRLMASASKRKRQNSRLPYWAARGLSQESALQEISGRAYQVLKGTGER